MGTNFYARLTLKSRDRFKAIKNQIDEYYSQYKCEGLYGKYVEVHLGKRSCGWKFLFNANKGELYELSRKGITKFLEENKVKVYDEYGRSFTIKEFWEEEVPWEGLDCKKYYEKYPEERRCFYQSKPPEWAKKYNPDDYGEFYSDGLRFTTSQFFS